MLFFFTVHYSDSPNDWENLSNGLEKKPWQLILEFEERMKVKQMLKL